MLEEAGAETTKPGMAHSVANPENAGMNFFLSLFSGYYTRIFHENTFFILFS